MLLLRKILFYLFIFIYLSVCPLIIFYALGITFSSGPQTIQKTGLISLATIPAQADVYLNGELLPERTPTVIRNLSAGDYTLKISLKDYMPWQKTLTVQKEKATAAENILLVPLEWPLTSISPMKMERLAGIYDQPFTLLINGPFLENMYLYRPEKGLSQFISKNDQTLSPFNPLEPLFPDNFPFLKGKLMQLFTIPKSPFLICKVNIQDQQKFFWIDLRPKILRIKEITDLFPENPENILWEPEEDHIIFSLQNQSINRIDISSGAIYPRIIDRVKSFNVFKHSLYVLTTDFIFKRMDYNANNTQTLLGESDLSRKLFPEKEKILISILKDDLFLFLNGQGKLTINRLPHELVQEKVKAYLYDERKKQLLFWTEHKIGILDFSKEWNEDLFEEGPILRWLNIEGKSIEQAFWVNKDGDVLFQDGLDVYLVEVEDFNQTIVHKITHIKEHTHVNYVDSNGKLFFLDEKTGFLSMINVLPEPEKLSLPTLEKEIKIEEHQL